AGVPWARAGATAPASAAAQANVTRAWTRKRMRIPPREWGERRARRAVSRMMTRPGSGRVRGLRNSENSAAETRLAGRNATSGCPRSCLAPLAERAEPAPGGGPRRRAGALEARERHGDVVRPAALVRERDQLAAGVVERVAHRQRGDLAVAHLPVQAVRAHDE